MVICSQRAGNVFVREGRRKVSAEERKWTDGCMENGVLSTPVLLVSLSLSRRSRRVFFQGGAARTRIWMERRGSGEAGIQSSMHVPSDLPSYLLPLFLSLKYARTRNFVTSGGAEARSENALNGSCGLRNEIGDFFPTNSNEPCGNERVGARGPWIGPSFSLLSKPRLSADYQPI